jgi:hypothetical protein
MGTTSGSKRTNGGTIMLPQKLGWLDLACCLNGRFADQGNDARALPRVSMRISL